MAICVPLMRLEWKGIAGKASEKPDAFLFPDIVFGAAAVINFFARTSPEFTVLLPAVAFERVNCHVMNFCHFI